MSLKSIVSICLLIIFSVSTIALYQKFSAKPIPPKKKIEEAKKGYQDSKKKASEKVKEVHSRKPLEEVVSVGSTVTAEVLEELQKREVQDISAIQAQSEALSKADEVIRNQDTYILSEENKVIIWKIISGVIVVIAIIIIL